MNDPLSAFGLSKEEVLVIDETLKDRPTTRDGRICICGHGAGRHKMIGGYSVCNPSRMSCPCKALRAVLDVEDTRSFLRKTSGGGPLHALTRGIAAMPEEKYKTAKWLVEMKCDRCGEVSNLAPVPVTQNGIATDYPTGYDALLCETCRTEV